MYFFDSHSHYNDEKFKDDMDIMIEKAKEAGIEKIIVVGYNIETSKKAIHIANTHKNMYATVGISPNDIDNEIDWIELENIAQSEKVVAIGEIGLDYH